MTYTTKARLQKAGVVIFYATFVATMLIACIMAITNN